MSDKQAAEPVWIGPQYSGEGHATIQCGDITAKVGYTALVHVLHGIRLDSAALHWTVARDFVVLLEDLQREAARTTDMEEVRRRVAAFVPIKREG